MGFISANFHVAFVTYIEELPGAFLVTMYVTFGAVVIGIILGLILTVGYLSHSVWLAYPARAATYLFRAFPVPPFFLLVYFGILTLIFPIDPGQAGMVALGILLAPYMAELFRAGMQSVSRGKIEAGLALGMSEGLVLRRIVLPLALRTMLPAIGQLVVGTIINSAFVAILGATDITGMARKIIYRYFATELYAVVMVTYFVISYPVSRWLIWLERRLRIYV